MINYFDKYLSHIFIFSLYIQYIHSLQIEKTNKSSSISIPLCPPSFVHAASLIVWKKRGERLREPRCNTVVAKVHSVVRPVVLGSAVRAQRVLGGNQIRIFFLPEVIPDLYPKTGPKCHLKSMHANFQNQTTNLPQSENRTESIE